MNNPCNCICHNEGTSIMHFMACCDRTYEKFRDKDGNLIQAVWDNPPGQPKTKKEIKEDKRRNRGNSND